MDIFAALFSGALDRIELECPRLRALNGRIEIADEPAPRHVANKTDVVSGGVDRTTVFALRIFALAENADADITLFGDLTEKIAAQIMRAIVQADYRRAFKHQGAKPPLQLLT